MKHLKLYENFDFNEDDFDEEELPYEEFKIGDQIRIKDGVKQLTVTRSCTSIHVDSEYESWNNLIDDSIPHYIREIEYKSDGTQVILIKYKTPSTLSNYWCWFYANEWEKV